MAHDNYLDDDYWYTDQDMHSLLQHRLQGTRAVILAPVVLQGEETENHISLMEANIAASLGYLEGGASSVVIPVHLNGNHWTGLVLEQVDEGYVGYYADSLGHSIPHRLNQRLTAIGVDVTQTVLSETPQQTNGNDCGVWTVENLVSMSQTHGLLPIVDNVQTTRTDHRKTGLIGEESRVANLEKRLSDTNDKLRTAQSDLDEILDKFDRSFLRCESLQKAAFEKSSKFKRRGNIDRDNTSPKAKRMNSLAKLLAFKGPYIAVAETHDGKCFVSFPSQTDSDLTNQESRVRSLVSTLQNIQSDDSTSRREIFKAALENSNVKANAFIVLAEQSDDRTISASARNIRIDLTRGRSINERDLDDVFKYCERRGQVFFDSEDIRNVHDLLQGKDVRDYIEVLDTRNTDERLCHVGLNAVGKVIDRAKSSGVDLKDSNIGLGSSANYEVGTCCGCNIVLDVLAEKRGLTISRTADFPENYPQSTYPYPKYLKLSEKKAIVVKIDDLLRQDTTHSLEFDSATQQYHTTAEDLKQNYKDIKDAKRNIQELELKIEKVEQRREKLESAKSKFERDKEVSSSTIQEKRTKYKEYQVQRSVAQARII